MEADFGVGALMKQSELIGLFCVSQAGQLLRGSAMTAERVFQVTILGLFIFSAVLAAMLILNP